MPRVSRSADGTAAGVDVGRGTAQPNAQATDTEATNMKACSVLTSNKSSVIGDGVLVTQCFVDGVAVVLNLDDHGVGVSGEGSSHVDLNGLG